MKLIERNGKYIAVADKGKAFKIDDVLMDSRVIESAEEAQNLVEVYAYKGKELDAETGERILLLLELDKIEKWFTSTDYIPNKVLVGEWERTDSRFVDYCEKRKEYRARQDELNELLIGRAMEGAK